MLAETPSILVPTDFSRASTEAFGTAADLARRLGGDTTLLFAHISSEPPLIPGISRHQLAEMHQGHLEKAQEELQRLSQAYFQQVEQRAVVVEGAAARAIVDFARENPMDIIVMAGHGGHGLRGTLLGSVCQRVLNHAPCPVLVVPQTAARGGPGQEGQFG